MRCRGPRFLRSKRAKQLRARGPNKFEQSFSDSTGLTFNNAWFFLKTRLGYKVPDFVDRKQKKIIELFGDYWHDRSEVAPLRGAYRAKGYDLLVIWESEWNRDRKACLQRVAEFLHGSAG